MTVAEVEEAPAELPLVEALAAVAGNGAQRAGDAGESHGLANGQGPVGAQLAGTGKGMHEVAGQRQHDGRGIAVLGQFDGGGEDVSERQPPVALVQGEPTVDGAGHLHAADVAPHGHRRQAVAAQAFGVGPRTGPADGEERLGLRPWRRHHRQHVAPEPAQVRAHDGHRRPRGDGGVGGGAALVEHAEARRRRQLVGGRHHAAQPRARNRKGRGEGTWPPGIARSRRQPNTVDSDPPLRGGANGHGQE